MRRFRHSATSVSRRSSTARFRMNDAVLTDILANDFVKFGHLFSTPTVSPSDCTISPTTSSSSDGIIETRSRGLKTQIDGFGDRRELLNEKLASLETRLLRQFNALDSLLAATGFDQ